MPGLIVKVDVEVGQEVQEGQALCTVEAMKMENILRAERKGVVSKINAAAGDSLAVDDIIMEFEDHHDISGNVSYLAHFLLSHRHFVDGA